MNKISIFIIIILAACLNSGCNGKSIKYTDPGYDQIKKDKTKFYIMGAGDVIKVTIFEKWPYSPDNATTEATIREDGTILVPPIGKVIIENMSVNDAEARLTGLLAEFLTKPFCEIEVKEFNSRKVCILGDVRGAKTLDIKSNDRILDILTRVDGRQDRTYLGPLKLVRKVNGQVNIYDVDMKRIVQDGHLDENVLVADGDIIFVPKHPIDEATRFLNFLTFWVPTYFVTRTLQKDLQ
jgi:polysaccharide biosynthesis/export protein